MPVWGWVLIAIAAVAVIALIAWQSMSKRRTKRLQEQFGPEYERTIEGSKNRRDAESQLTAREKRREQLDVRPLSSAARERYEKQWETIQAQFVDSPQAAVAAADSLIQDVMRDRGYPVEDFDQRAEDVSVDHPQVVDNYREGHRLAEQSANGRGSTEDLRQAMRHYRALFSELLVVRDGDGNGDSADHPLARDTSTTASDRKVAR
jgi:hypothetical protein